MALYKSGGGPYVTKGRHTNRDQTFAVEHLGNDVVKIKSLDNSAALTMDAAKARCAFLYEPGSHDQIFYLQEEFWCCNIVWYLKYNKSTHNLFLNHYLLIFKYSDFSILILEIINVSNYMVAWCEIVQSQQRSKASVKNENVWLWWDLNQPPFLPSIASTALYVEGYEQLVSRCLL